MPAPTSDVPETRNRRDRKPEPRAVDVVALVDDSRDDTTLTFCPAQADATDLVTTWLTVDEDAVVDLDELR